MKASFDLSWLYVLGGIRRQTHVATLILAVLLVALPTYVSAFSLGTNAYERVTKDFGLTLIGLFGVGMAVLIGSTSLARDLESRSIYPILARPIRRSGYLVAHLLALFFSLASSLFFLGICLTLSLAVKSGKFDTGVMVAVYGSLLQAIVVGAVCLVFSIVCSPPLAGTLGVATFLVGNLSGSFVRFFLVEDRQSWVSASLAKALKAVVPNLSLFDVKDPMVHDLVLPTGYLGAVSGYAVVWLCLLLALARLAFQRVDL